jgi:hypothetical protein
MRYTITVWKLTGKTDEVEGKYECHCETYWNAVEMFDLILRGIGGHYRAWLTDNESGAIRESSVTWNN